MSAARAWRRALAVAGAVLVLDQALKEIVTESLLPGERIDLVPGLRLTNVSNQGIAFGLLDDGEALVIAVTAFTLALVLAWFALDPTRRGHWLGIGLLAGGALGNLADRVRSDAVTDYLDPAGWPAFNLADIAITVGTALLVYVALERDRASP